MKIRCAAACLTACTCGAAAHASLTGVIAETTVLANGRHAMNVYATFSNETDRLISVAHAFISTNAPGGFYQDPNRPYWAPQSQPAFTSDDSFVAIGVAPNGNAVASSAYPGPSFINFDDSNGSTDFSVIETSPEGAEWWSGQVGSIGVAVGFRVLLARFVAVDTPELQGASVRWTSSFTYLNAAGSSFQTGGFTREFMWVPGPGGAVVAAFALSAGRRARGTN